MPRLSGHSRLSRLARLARQLLNPLHLHNFRARRFPLTVTGRNIVRGRSAQPSVIDLRLRTHRFRRFRMKHLEILGGVVPTALTHVGRGNIIGPGRNCLIALLQGLSSSRYR